MKVALFAAARDGLVTSELALGLLSELRGHADVDAFVPAGTEGRDLRGRPTRAASELRPREFDQLLYVAEDVQEAAWMLPFLQHLGGSVMIERWGLPTLAVASAPVLERPGLRGYVAAVKAGGLNEAGRWRQHVRAGSVTGGALALNRGVVRFGDAFLVPEEELGRRIRADRNEPTPIYLHGSRAPDFQGLGAEVLEALGRFPAARSARKRIVATMLAIGEENRRRKKASAEGVS